MQPAWANIARHDFAFFGSNALLICQANPKRLCYRQMTASNCLFVRIRNSEGKYLGGDARKMDFYDDINRAIIFDCRRDRIDQQIEYIRITQGIVLEPVPVDPKEIHETCDRCGRLALSFQMFYDGERYLCGECRNAGSTSSGRVRASNNPLPS